MNGYSNESNTTMLIAYLKKHGIKKVVVSPGSTNMSFVASLQYDGTFEMYSCVDERSAAYMACGLSMESGEPVVLSCTGSTASRNYLSALTEAYNRKLPIIAVTSSQELRNEGHLIPQFIDRTQPPKDAVKYSTVLEPVKDDNDRWRCEIQICRALNELNVGGGGPIHINLITTYNYHFTEKALPSVREIKLYKNNDTFPDIKKYSRIAIFVGCHKIMSTSLTEAIDSFCKANNAIVFVDHASNYYGKYAVHATIAAAQETYDSKIFDFDLLIHIGEQSGDYSLSSRMSNAKEIWRVSEDGVIRDTFRKLAALFVVDEEAFFTYYSMNSTDYNDSYYNECISEIKSLRDKCGDLPFSNVWVARMTSSVLPNNSYVHLGVSNTLRAWNMFELPDSCRCFSNVGSRGIDGAISSCLGMSLVNPLNTHFCFLGDLSFFYDVNSLGNRHLKSNFRLMVINNGEGAAFNYPEQREKIVMGEDVSTFVAAKGHYNSKSLIKYLSEGLGFAYICANNKETFLENLDYFCCDKALEKPIIFEVFTDVKDENDAMKKIRNINTDVLISAKKATKKVVKNILKM